MKTIILAFALLLCTASLTQAQEPMCVIDGVILSSCSSAQQIDPQRIEHIEIVKGESAAKLYGSRAANGVILIRTKRGGESPTRSINDPLASVLFPPELVMANQLAIELTESQRSAIQSAVSQAQSKFVGLQFAVAEESEKLKKLLEGTTVDQAAVLAQVDRVFAAEREIKREQLALMVRIKNLLTAEQQTKLSVLRR